MIRSTECKLTKQTMGRVLRRTSTKQRSMMLVGHVCECVNHRQGHIEEVSARCRHAVNWPFRLLSVLGCKLDSCACRFPIVLDANRFPDLHSQRIGYPLSLGE
jgi:hypothetical protein